MAEGEKKGAQAAAAQSPAPEIRELSRDDIVGAQDREVHRIYVPEWRGYVYVRSMSARERDALEMEQYRHRQDTKRPEVDRDRTWNWQGRMACRVLCDRDGRRLFEDGEHSLLGEKNEFAVARIIREATKLNVISSPDVEEAEKNFESALSGGSSSLSPAS